MDSISNCLAQALRKASGRVWYLAPSCIWDSGMLISISLGFLAEDG